MDHIGPFARSVEDIALAFEVLQGSDPRDPICTDRPPITPDLSGDMTGIRVAMATGRSKTIATDHFSRGMTAPVAQALDKVSSALRVTQTVTLPESAQAKAAAYLIAASEGSQLHLPRLQTRLQDFDPATRDRFVAGAMIPNSWYLQAQRFRRWYRDQVREIFKTVDLIIAPTTPCPAPLIDQTSMELDGQTVPIRPHLGYYTQPLSFIGLPVLSVPIFLPGELPVGIQLIARPYDENTIFKVAVALEKQGITEAKLANTVESPSL